MKMLLVDDLSIVRIIQRFFRKLFPDLIFYFQDQSVFYGPVAVNIIRSYTGLSAVQEFPKNNPFAASFRFAVFSTMQGLFPPSSKVTGVRNCAAFAMTSFPTCWLPVKRYNQNVHLKDRYSLCVPL